MKYLKPLAQDGKINEDANLRDRQSILINAPIDKIWGLLFEVNKWPEWNMDIKIDRYTTTEEGESFKWQIRGQSIKSTFQKINKPVLLAWTSHSQLTKAVNVWKLEQAGDNQTIVTAEESMEGFSTLFIGHQKLHNILIAWLNHLKAQAES